MSFTRRTLLIGAGAGLTVLAVAACTDVTPTPTSSPTPRPDRVPAPASFARSNWAADPFARGAVSYQPVDSLPESRVALRASLDDRVFFAGEATSDEPGTISGAVSSGVRAAREVLDVVDDGERVAIIGAGAAGAAAARLLTNLGVDTIIVEARDRVGGRIDSRTTGDGVSYELGAWKLGVEADSAVIAALDDLNIGTVTLAGDLVAEPVGAIALADLAAAQVQTATALATWAAAQTADASIASALEESGAATAVGDLPADAAGAIYAEAVRVAAGAQADAVSTWFPPASIGADSALPVGELSAFVTADLDGVTLALSTAVVGVAHDDDGVSLRLGSGESIKVDRVIVTVPLGVLQAGTIEFDPTLPLSMRAAINSLGVGQVEIVRVGFDEPFWTTDAVVWSLAGTLSDGADTTIGTWINLQPLTGEIALIGIAAGDAAASLKKVSDDALAAMVREQLEPFAD